VPIPETAAPRPLEAKIILRAGEPGGRAVERSLVLPILPKAGLIGVKKNFTTLSDGAAASFDVIGVPIVRTKPMSSCIHAMEVR
jgi:uncharacterized protein YfaS (alpha-2-macroglobulin family)